MHWCHDCLLRPTTHSHLHKVSPHGFVETVAWQLVWLSVAGAHHNAATGIQRLEDALQRYSTEHVRHLCASNAWIK